MSFQTSSSLRTARICYLVGCSILSIACSAIYALLLVGEWNNYTMMQRAIMISLAAVHALGALVLLSMLLARFRLWFDVTCLGIFLAFQLAAAVVFTLFNSRFPCTRALGSEANCRVGTVAVSIGSGVVTALLMIYGIGLAVVTYTSRTTISDVTHDTKQRWQQSHSVANGNVDPKKSKRSSSETSSSQDSFFTPTFPNRQYPTPTYQSQPTPDGLHRPDTPSSIYSTSTYTSIRRGPHDNVEQGMLYQPGPVYPSSRSIASVESSGEVEQGTSLSAIPSRVRYDYSRKSARTPSPAPSVSSHGSSSSLLPGRPPRTLSPPVQGYDFRSRSPQRPMQPFHPERMIGPYPSVFNSPPPRGQEYGMATQLSQVPPFHHRQRLRPTGQLPANVRTVPLALRHARGNVNGRYAPSDSDHSFESSLRSPSASVRSPPSTPIPQDVSEADDIPVITPYGGIADEPHFLGLPSGPKAQRGQNTGYARHE